MTAPRTRLTPVPAPRGRDIPKIKLLSWLGLESVLWGVVIAHLVKWAVSFGYFAAFQVRYAVGYHDGLWTVWYLKDWWDRLPVHAANLLGLHWYPGQQAPAWWVTDRHYIRDVGIAVIATIIVRLLFVKPKYPADDQPGVRVYLTRIPLALAAALIPIAVIGAAAWQLPWLTRHGLAVPARFGAAASEANAWIAAGEWIAVLMGIAGGLAAALVIQRIADDIQWFFAERSAAKVRDDTGLNALRGHHVYGTPAHRARVRWLLARDLDLPPRNPWLVRALLAAMIIGLLAAGAGAWLILVGPAAPH